MEDRFNVFIDDLANTKVPENAYNQFSYLNKENSVRRKNLLIYLNQMYKLHPKIILIAEAPGYRGSRITGVPFTSEDLLMNNINGLNLFGREKGYRLPIEKEKLTKEATATIIWNTLVEYDIFAIGWNAFPFHPHKENDFKTNRTPTKQELLIGEQFLLRMIEMFNIEKIVAVGNKSKDSLDKLGIDSTKVRHPAQGGKNEFVRGISELQI